MSTINYKEKDWVLFYRKGIILTGKIAKVNINEKTLDPWFNIQIYPINKNHTPKYVLFKDMERKTNLKEIIISYIKTEYV